MHFLCKRGIIWVANFLIQEDFIHVDENWKKNLLHTVPQSTLCKQRGPECQAGLFLLSAFRLCKLQLVQRLCQSYKGQWNFWIFLSCEQWLWYSLLLCQAHMWELFQIFSLPELWHQKFRIESWGPHTSPLFQWISFH